MFAEMRPVCTRWRYLVGLVPLAASAAMGSQWEDSFLPSPNGQYVVSVVNRDLSLPIPPEGLELSASVAIRIRDSKGKELATVPIAKGRRAEEIGYGHVGTAWNPDSQMVACCNQGNLSVIDVTGHGAQKRLTSVSSYRWVDKSRLCAVTGPLDGSGLFSVTDIATSGGAGHSRMTAVWAHAFHPSVTVHYNQLSPNLGHVVMADGAQVQVTRLNETTDRRVVQRSMTPSSCWWSDSGDRCLIHCLEEAKTEKPWPEDTTFRDVVYLFETTTGGFTDLSDRLRGLNDDPNFSSPRPRAEDRVWAPPGNWILVSGTIRGSSGPESRNWVCVPNPWSAVCIQDALQSDFHNPKVAPTGGRLGLLRASTDYAPKGDLYVVQITIDGGGKPVLGKPVEIATGIPNSWFWSADGKQLLVWNGRKFTNYIIP